MGTDATEREDEEGFDDVGGGGAAERREGRDTSIADERRVEREADEGAAGMVERVSSSFSAGPRLNGFLMALRSLAVAGDFGGDAGEVATGDDDSSSASVDFVLRVARPLPLLVLVFGSDSWTRALVLGGTWEQAMCLVEQYSHRIVAG